MTKVHCHSQEYWTVTPMKCQCGTPSARKSPGIQRLYERQSVHVDALRVRCTSCGREADLEFDSPFFGRPDVAGPQSLPGDHRTLSDIFGCHDLGMESVLSYFSEAAASGDIDALEYLSDAVGHFLEKAREASGTAPN
jgi:hypothetical protein